MFTRLCVIFTVVLLNACVAIAPFPGVARQGDTITLAVGSVDGATRDNITVEFYADSNPGVPIDVTASVRNVLRIYPDKTSRAYFDVDGLETIDNLNQLSNHAAWQSVVVLDLPLTLTPGTGYFSVSFDSEVVYPEGTVTVADVDIPFEIIADAGGSPHQFEYRKFAFNTETSVGDLSELKAMRQVVIRRSPLTGFAPDSFSAAQYEISVPVLDSNSNDVSLLMTNDQFAVVLDDQPEYIRNQTNLIWTRDADIFKVIITASAGVQNINKLRFSILISDLDVVDAGWELSSSPLLNSVTYYDDSGNEISGLTPQVVLLD